MSKMVTLSDDPKIEMFKPKKYKRLRPALDALYNLDYYDFLMYRGTNYCQADCRSLTGSRSNCQMGNGNSFAKA